MDYKGQNQLLYAGLLYRNRVITQQKLVYFVNEEVISLVTIVKIYYIMVHHNDYKIIKKKSPFPSMTELHLLGSSDSKSEE